MRFLLLFLLISVSTAILADGPAKVFVLHSYSQEYPWTKYQHYGFMDTLVAGSARRPLISTEYLDTKRKHYGEEYAAEFADYLKYKYSDYDPDLIYITDDNALVFALAHLGTIFPDAPIIFSGVNNYSIRARLDANRITGVFEQKEILKNIQLLERMDHDIENIVVVGDASNTYVAIEQDIKKALKQHSDIKATFIADENIDEIVDMLEQRDENYVFLTTLGGMNDTEGRQVTLKETTRRIVGAGDFVILSMEDAYLFNGVIGGFVTSGKKQGSTASRMALSYFSGTPINAIPVVTESPNEYIFDARELSARNLTLPKDIESNSTILNKSRSYYERNRKLVLGTIIGLVLLVFILMAIFLLVLTRSKRQLQIKTKHIHEQAETLQQVRDTLTAAQQVAHVGSWDWDILMGNLTWSDEIYRIYGLSPQQFDASYEAFVSTIHPDDREAVVAAVDRSVADAAVPYSIEHRIIRSDGQQRTVHEQGQVYRNADGEPVRMLGAVHDITVRKQAEESLRQSRDALEKRVRERTVDLEESIEQVKSEVEERKRTEQSLIQSREEALQAKEDAENANRMKSVFLSRMSHELRTPLNAILGFSQLLEMEGLAGKHGEFNLEVLKAGRHLLALIDEVLDLSALESGRVRLRMKDVNIRDAITEAIAMLTPLAERRGIRINRESVEEATLFVKADRTRLVEVLTNLLSNAIKYNSEGGFVLVYLESKRVDDKIRISVTDNGIGIPEDKRLSLFEPFNRLGAEYSDVEGTGIGLSICRELMQLMGGEIGFFSQAGDGSTFWIDCVSSGFEQSKAAPEVKKVMADGADSRGTVLYVEDNPANLHFMEVVLEQYVKFDMLAATTGNEGIRLARECRPEVIILDINLPDMDGYQVLSRLRNYAETRDIPVLAISAAAMPRDVDRGLAAGFLQYLTKPANVVDLINALNSARAARARESG